MSLVTIIVDDDPVACFLQKTVLKVSDFCDEPLSFENGLLALNYLRVNYISKNEYLVFLDINMPVMNGWDFLQEISGKFSDKNLRVIILSSSVQESDRNKAQSFHHVIDYLEKPIRPADLEQFRSCWTLRLSEFKIK